MRDIGNLERRIEMLNTILNLFIRTAAENLQIQDLMDLIDLKMDLL